jgi:hypothetical protein
MRHHEEAIAAAQAAQHLFTELGHQTEAARCAWLCGRAQLAGGNLEAGLKSLAEAREIFAAGGLWIEASLISCYEAEAELGAGRLNAARRRLEALCGKIPSDLQNGWVAEAVAKLQAALGQADIEPLEDALRGLTLRLNDGPAPVETGKDPTAN